MAARLSNINGREHPTKETALRFGTPLREGHQLATVGEGQGEPLGPPPNPVLVLAVSGALVFGTAWLIGRGFTRGAR